MPVTKVLVANRGEIARRVFRTCRAMSIGTVAVYVPGDSAEPHVGEADEAVALPGAGTAGYLDIPGLIAAAVAAGADAVHPGYGFLSENATFARAVMDADITWIGPPPEAIELMGSKIAAKRLMEEIGVPTIPSFRLENGDAPEPGVTLEFPILVKASAGGGGKGMRIVEDPGALPEAISSARREAASAFGDDTVFLEKYLAAPRHIEIQVFADTRGNTVSMFERECSIQRRHQKIVEESPSPAIDASTRARMGETAVRAAGAVGYVGAGTVEFLYSDDEYFFLEMNTRLQVEHPVTEMITGLDMVRLQIEVAEGKELPTEALTPSIDGHAIEVRLYAEDPANDFLPATGPVFEFAFDTIPGLRVDSGVEAGSRVSIEYDPMLAKVIAHAPDRREAALKLAHALRTARIHSGMTNRALLVRILESEDFLAGRTDTGFLATHRPEDLGAPLLTPAAVEAAAIAAALCDIADRRLHAPVQGSIPPGWRNSPGDGQRSVYLGPYGEHEIEYLMSPTARIVGRPDFALHSLDADAVEFDMGADRYLFRVARYDTVRFCDSPDGGVRLELQPRFSTTILDAPAGSLRAPMPGKVLRVDVSVGDRVDEGATLLVLEAMKMEHTLKSPHEGTVAEVLTTPGDQVEADSVLVVFGDLST